MPEKNEGLTFGKTIGLALSLSVVATRFALCEDTPALRSKVVDKDGTVITTETLHHESTNSAGTKTVTTDVKRTTDPKGLFNKKTETFHFKKEEKPNGDEVTEVSGIDKAGTHLKDVGSQVTKVDGKDGPTTTVKETQVIDPKGLRNKKVIETTSTLKGTDQGKTTTAPSR